MLSAGETKVTMSDKLLNTAEAARFLRVSSASVRRWSDSGLLRSRRVGPRRERRFTEADLESFLTPGSSAAARPGVPGKDVFVGGTHIPLHSHISTFYDSDDGRLRLTVPFLRDGLILGEPCFLIADGPALDAYLEALSGEGVDVAAAIRDQKLTTAPRPGTSVEAALHFWDQVLTRGLAAGPTLLRAVGEMGSARKGFESDAQMIEYEVALNTIAKRLPTVTMCQYDVREFDGHTIFQAIRAHPDLYPLGIASFLI
jgi:excisionase family DNA binding protein